MLGLVGCTLHVESLGQVRQPNPNDSSIPLSIPARYYQAQFIAVHDHQLETWIPLAEQAGNADLAHALRSFVPSSPTSDLALQRDLASGYFERGDWFSFQQTLQNLLAIAPSDPFANFHMGLMTAILTPDQAHPYLQIATDEPIYADVARALRVLLLEQGEAMGYDPVFSRFQIGLLYLNFEMWTYAEFTFNQVNTLSIATNQQPYPLALAYLSLARTRQGKDGGQAIRDAVRLAPSHPEVRYLEGLNYRHQKDYANSLNAMIQAVALDSDNAALYAELGTAYRLVGQIAEAESWLQIALAYSGNDPQFARILEEFYAQEAWQLGISGLQTLNERLNITPEDPNLLVSLALTYYRMGETTLALDTLDLVIQRIPDYTAAHFYKAIILLESDPTNTQVRPLLETVANSDSDYRADAVRILETLTNS